MRRLSIVSALVGACLLLAADGLAGNGGVAPPESATSSGSAINELYWILIGICAFILIVVEGALLTFIVRFRRRRGTADAEGPQIHGNTRLELASADVVHSWWVPELTGKRQAVPGRLNTLSFAIERPGTYGGQCSFFCGVEHASMYTQVEALPEGEFNAWLERQAAAQSAGRSDLGRATWEGVCAKCHGLDGRGGYGPAIAGSSTLSNRNVLGNLLATGQNNEQIPGFMPPVGRGWPDKQLDALIAYMVRAGLAPAPASGQEQEEQGG